MIQEFADLAQNSGWTEDEVATALICVVASKAAAAYPED
jgi:hypothetical protein